MTPFEIDKAMKSMVILVDTREQETSKFRKRVASFGYPWRREKLDSGDYACEYTDPRTGEVIRLSSAVSIERKMDLDELCQCFTRDRKRFEAEFVRAAGTRMYLIVENADWEDVYSGRYRSRMSPQALKASILTFATRYDIHVHFLRNSNRTGQHIADILHYELRERLENDDNELGDGDHEQSPN